MQRYRTTLSFGHELGSNALFTKAQFFLLQRICFFMIHLATCIRRITIHIILSICIIADDNLRNLIIFVG